MISQHAIDLWKADGSLLIPADASRAAKERQRHASGNRQAASTSVPSSNNADEVEAAVQQLKAAEIKIKLDC